jgi:chromosome partitioning protein
MINTVDRAALGQVIAVANGKGGVGKTSTSAHLAALFAAAGQRVLLVDLDPQANLGDDLGFQALHLGDDGAGLARAVQYGEAPYILKEVRPGLDVIPGGGHLDELAAVLAVRLERGDTAVTPELSLAYALASTTANYDLTILDCPPRHPVLQQAALVMARWLLIPAKTDVSSLRGLEEMERRFRQASVLNADLRLLGVLLFGVTSAAKVARKAATEWITTSLGDQAPVFAATIRHVEAPAALIRARGQLAHELEMGSEAGATKAMAAAATKLAGDYQAVATEVYATLLRMETARS